MEKEHWKDEVLKSLAGIKKAEPDTFLFTRIEARLEQTTRLSKLQLRLAGVCMILMVVANIWIASTSQKTSASENNSLTTTYRY